MKKRVVYVKGEELTEENYGRLVGYGTTSEDYSRVVMEHRGMKQ